MKIIEDLNLQFKEVEFICKCGERKKEVMLIEGDYGFQSSHCESCGRRNFVEYESGFLTVKSV
ncbi:MAG TPA: hypothetical protein ENO34_02070 [Sulfurihydrogenibium azorense]|uniref:Uncharacterized protein n=1 Tax=Sulfurihydrogenibium azorense TaxID=309806 RepID=A0A832DQJ0_9AQUI|nr:MAG: hypothetical protein C0178_04655 [Sulfurihydrogenibium sp.]HEV09169.1 hypothetical protein [Sulfurihydrogenibium azorense]